MRQLFFFNFDIYNNWFNGPRDRRGFNPKALGDEFSPCVSIGKDAAHYTRSRGRKCQVTTLKRKLCMYMNPVFNRFLMSNARYRTIIYVLLTYIAHIDQTLNISCFLFKLCKHSYLLHLLQTMPSHDRI